MPSILMGKSLGRRPARRKAGVVVFTVVGMLVAGPAIGQVVNGSFESGGFVADSNQLMSLAPGSTVMAGWTTFNAELVWADNANPFVTPGADGAKFLDLSGYHDVAPFGGVLQALLLTSGQAYEMTFELGVEQVNPAFAGPITVRAAAAGAPAQDFTYNPVSVNGVPEWGQFAYDFVASPGSTDLSLLGISGGQFIGLDNVQLTAVPEPTGLSLIGGLAAARFVGRRRRRGGHRAGRPVARSASVPKE